MELSGRHCALKKCEDKLDGVCNGQIESRRGGCADIIGSAGRLVGVLVRERGDEGKQRSAPK